MTICVGSADGGTPSHQLGGGGSIPASTLVTQGDIFEAMREPFSEFRVAPVKKAVASDLVLAHHYLHRRPPISFCYGLWHHRGLVGVVTFGVPPSRHLQMGACPTDPSLVLELNRLWVHDKMPRNSESRFLALALRLLPPRIIVSYADTAHQHTGYVYRASNFYYAGWTDMERKTPRYDYLVPGKHTRDAFRTGQGAKSVKVRRKPKHKYWTTTGDRRDRARLELACGWPKMDWRVTVLPSEATA